MFVLVDAVSALIPGESLRAVKCVSLSDPGLREHFRLAPIFPASLITEAMAQAAGVLIEESQLGRHHLAILTGIDRARFRQAVRPGQVLELTVTMKALREFAAQVTVVAEVAGARVAEAELTFVLRHEPSAELCAERAALRRMLITGAGYADATVGPRDELLGGA